jgi:subtilisin family serine protease
VQRGTSFATSTLTGLCALYLGAHPALTPYELKALLKSFATEAAPRR